jgi:hypothetical protein
MKPGLLVSDRLSLTCLWTPRSRSKSLHRLVLEEVPDRPSWWPPLYLYLSFGCQKGSRLGGWPNHWHWPFFVQRTKLRHNRWLKVGVSLVRILWSWTSVSPTTVSDVGNLHYPTDVDRSLNASADDKIRKYRTDYNNNPPNSISFMPVIPSTSGVLHLQEFILSYIPVDSSTFAARHSPLNLKRMSSTPS